VIIPALRAALALNCKISEQSFFDRKHYFYWDQPAGYQITQYYQPFARDGHVTVYDHDGIAAEDGTHVVVGIQQVQLEQDTAKTLQQPPTTHLLDLNRVSHPLIEIITHPVMHHPETAAAYVRKVQSTLKSVSAAVLGMEVGGLRADVNVSVRRKGQSELGQRTEIKNLSSIKAVEDAIIAERDRQIDVLKQGGTIRGETRGWTIGGTSTHALRDKEGEVDYRYMPDPDLGMLRIDPSVIAHIADSLPHVQDSLIDTLCAEPYDLTLKDAKTLLTFDDGERVEYLQNVVDILLEEGVTNGGKIAGNWVLHELGRLIVRDELKWSDNPVDAKRLAEILTLLLKKRISGTTARLILALPFDGDLRPVETVIKEQDLYLRPMSETELLDLTRSIFVENSGIVEQAKVKGDRGKIHWLVGQIMRRADEGRVDAKQAEAIVRRLLEN
jgi:aspartyl-tRNA(Asn)/glutamyl-tRNA(Gln) amidotransferase subunit B